MKATAQQIYQELNKLRTNPKSYIPDLETMLKQFKGNILYAPGQIALSTNEGPSAVQECIQVLKNQVPLPALEFDNNIEKAARDHAQDIGPKGISDHTGSDGSSMSQRMERYGTWGGHIGECIDFGNHPARTVIISLIVDDGVSSRGHRKNCLSSNFKKVGIAVAQHKVYGMTSVFDFAGQFTQKGQTGTQQPTYVPQKPTYVPQQQTYVPQQQTYVPQQQTYVPQQQQKIQLNQKYSSGISSGGSTNGSSNHSLQNQQANNEMPPGCVGKKTQTQTTVSGNTKTVKTTTTYTMKDGSSRTETRTQTTTTG